VYRKGRLFEYKVRDKLLEMGFAVFRCAGSKPVDLIAIRPDGKVFLIECKRSKKPTKKEIEENKAYAEQYKAEYVIVMPKDLKNIEGKFTR
jgi:Holliday junction resolvase